jgi:hypothetical protein
MQNARLAGERHRRKKKTPAEAGVPVSPPPSLDQKVMVQLLM